MTRAQLHNVHLYIVGIPLRHKNQTIAQDIQHQGIDYIKNNQS